MKGLVVLAAFFAVSLVIALAVGKVSGDRIEKQCHGAGGQTYTTQTGDTLCLDHDGRVIRL